MKNYLRVIRSLLSRRYHGSSYNKDYYRIFHKYDSLHAYLALYRKCEAAGKHFTNVGISFRSVLRFGLTLKEAVASLPPDSYKLFPQEHHKIQVVFYRTAIAGFRVKCQLHFFDNRLFLCSYTFSYLRESERLEIISVLEQKYLAGKPYIRGQTIVDQQESCIYPESGMELTINYLWVHPSVRNSLELHQKQLETEHERKARAHNEELYSSL